MFLVQCRECGIMYDHMERLAKRGNDNGFCASWCEHEYCRRICDVSRGSTALQSIDQFIGENHEGLSVPMTTLNQAISNLIEGNGKAIKGLTSRVVKAIDRHVVTNDEQVDSALTTLLQGIDAWLSSQEYALTLMSSKGGLLEIGEPLAAVLAEDAAQGKQLAYQGTLVLSIREAEGKIDELIEVLREIRDRMPGQPVQSAWRNAGTR